MTIKDLEEIYKVTGLNLFFVFRTQDYDHLDPKILQALVWWKRKKENPELKFEEVNDFRIIEVVEAWNLFFREEE